MIEIYQHDDYGMDYIIDTFLSVQDAKDALWSFECALEDTTSTSRAYVLQNIIADLREQIREAELKDED